MPRVEVTPEQEARNEELMARARLAVAMAEDDLPNGTMEQVEQRAVEHMAMAEEEMPMMKLAKDDEPRVISDTNQGLVTAIEEAVETAVDSVVQVIVLTLKSKDHAKFAEAARLCNIGQGLMRTKAKRVSDFAVLDDGVDEAAPRAYLRDGQPDAREVERNHMLTFGPVAQLTAEAQRTAVATNEATELQSLTNLRGTLPEDQRAPIDARIATLITHMEARNHANDPTPDPGVVSADVPRGHPPGEGGADENPPPGVRANGVGGEGHGVAAFTCRIDETAQEVGG